MIVVLLICFSLFTAFYLEEGYLWSAKRSESVTIKSSFTGGDGYYNTRLIRDFSPGKYEVTVNPIGENITVLIRSYKESVEKNITNSDKKLTFEIEIESAVWQGILIEDAPEVNFTGNEEVMTINYEKIEDSLEMTTWILLTVSVTGGVTFAANEARIYRKKRQ